MLQIILYMNLHEFYMYHNALCAAASVKVYKKQQKKKNICHIWTIISYTVCWLYTVLNAVFCGWPTYIFECLLLPIKQSILKKRNDFILKYFIKKALSFKTNVLHIAVWSLTALHSYKGLSLCVPRLNCFHLFSIMSKL